MLSGHAGGHAKITAITFNLPIANPWRSKHASYSEGHQEKGHAVAQPVGVSDRQGALLLLLLVRTYGQTAFQLGPRMLTRHLYHGTRSIPDIKAAAFHALARLYLFVLRASPSKEPAPFHEDVDRCA